MRPGKTASGTDMGKNCVLDKPGSGTCWQSPSQARDVVLYPYDILRLTNHLGTTTTEFIKHYCEFRISRDRQLPILQLKTKPRCAFNCRTCAVWKDRPQACRAMALLLSSGSRVDRNSAGLDLMRSGTWQYIDKAKDFEVLLVEVLGKYDREKRASLPFQKLFVCLFYDFDNPLYEELRSSCRFVLRHMPQYLDRKHDALLRFGKDVLVNQSR